ncbi:MAG: hypothetical protein OXG24_07515 [Gammaproteobacteria bacterium]|nr:hypothetical protein [Gammaproteobacteria bacterium]
MKLFVHPNTLQRELCTTYVSVFFSCTQMTQTGPASSYNRDQNISIEKRGTKVCEDNWVYEKELERFPTFRNA